MPPDPLDRIRQSSDRDAKGGTERQFRPPPTSSCDPHYRTIISRPSSNVASTLSRFQVLWPSRRAGAFRGN